ncbi:MAG: hypothetical protein HOM96_03135 [Rickettsiales bacterium]|jgi:hypothetical protein|nr:hypothetical protein [Rickettsiales bacterium]
MSDKDAKHNESNIVKKSKVSIDQKVDFDLNTPGVQNRVDKTNLAEEVAEAHSRGDLDGLKDVECKDTKDVSATTKQNPSQQKNTDISR